MNVKVMTRKNPFHQYGKDFQVIRALEIGREVPTRPGPKDDDQIDDRMWELMMKCWDYTPERRPSCGDIVASLGAQHVRSSSQELFEGGPFWESMRRKLDSRIDYERVRNILLRVARLRGQMDTSCMGKVESTNFH